MVGIGPIDYFRFLELWGDCPLWDPSPYLRDFRRKSRKTPKGEMDKRDKGMNPESPNG